MTSLPHEYGPLVRELLKRAALQRQPAHGGFELTSRCNLSCRMCYTRHPAGDVALQHKELPAFEWISLAREAVDQGMVFLLLTGGEALLRDDFFEIYEPLTHMGLMLTLFTNGTLITDAVAQRLAQSPPSRTEITLYGATAVAYESITGVPGSYEHCCAGIEALVKRQIPLGLKTTITRQNVGELEAMRQMAYNWGVPFTASWLLSRRPDGHPSEVEHCRLSVKDCVDLEASDRASAEEWTEVEHRESAAGNDGNHYCQAGKAAFVVSPAGDMNICLDLPFPAAHPLETGFRAAWAEVQRYVDAMPPVASACVACDARVYCGRCPAWSYLETGTLTEPVPYLCEIARRRKARYGFHV
jgi:radical SAM protein with 4Fe4S-binding SPASM domain